MHRLRFFAWLIALVAFVAPSLASTAALAPRAAEQPTMAGCAEHVPQPHCPDGDTAKHAAGLCCPLMACAAAMLPPVIGTLAVDPLHVPLAAVVPDLNGLTYSKDPPPPRV